MKKKPVKHTRKSDGDIKSSEVAVDGGINQNAGKSIHNSIVLCSVATYFVSAVLYQSTAYQTIPGGDTGELLAAVCEGGVAHPPGYPLWTLLNIAHIYMLPWITPIRIATFLNCQLAAFANSVLLLLSYRLTDSWSSAVITVIIFGLSPLVWTWSITTEVFALNNLLTACLLFVFVEFSLSQDSMERKWWACAGSFLSGLCMCNQHTVVVYILCAVVFVLWDTFMILDFTFVTKIILFGVIGLLPYLYLPISSYINVAQWSWGDQSNISGFLTHFLRAEYGSFDLGKESVGQGFYANLVLFSGTVSSQLGVHSYILALVGPVAIYFTDSQKVRVVYARLLVMLAAYVLFFCWRINLDISSSLMKEVVDRFWMQPLLIISVLTGGGFAYLVKRFSTPSFLNSTLVVGALAFHLFQGYAVCDKSQTNTVDRFANSLFSSFPPNSTVLTRGDLPTNAFRYKQHCERNRPDITLLDQELMSYPWFIPKLRHNIPNITFPGDRWNTKTGVVSRDGARLFNFKTLLDSNFKAGVPIFTCIGIQDRDDSWKVKEDYRLIPYGPCHQIVQDLSQWVDSTHPYKATWYQNYQQYKPGTWENVANEEMWNAMVTRSMFLWQSAETAPDSKTKSALHGKAFEEYRHTFSLHDRVPPYFHKNFALSAERMSKYSQSREVAKNYLVTTVEQFELYIQSGEADSQIDAIKQAVVTIKEQLKGM